MTTWNIAVCDDEQDEREEVLRLINRYNEELIPLSRHFRKEFEQGYINYLHETL